MQYIPKNQLQEAIQVYTKELDHTIIEDPDTFITQLNNKIIQLRGLHPRCNPTSAQINRIRHSGEENIRLHLEGNGSSFLTLEIHKIKEK
ncbi:hypothetical protein [Xanthocytophaga flava]|uniref:hypothetical protein n=1 Tax=Xanthocytophaga flava TaxID=3048013 RepID=UPI0028D18783|nr:hypothetical protein [Xanthocytophaga flavus]MDJ1472865.1 hypothetical protein [Xanthocytophaga flavus]